MTERNQPSRRMPSLGVVFATVGMLAVTTYLLQAVLDLLGGQDALASIVDKNILFGATLYVLLKSLTYVVAPLGGASVKFLAGALFGPVLGTILSILGEAIGGTLNFSIARRLSHTTFFRKRITTEMRSRASSLNNWKVLAGWRVLLSPIYDFLCYASGLSTIPYRTFLMVTVVFGAIPNFIMVSVGSGLLSEAAASKTNYAFLGLGVIWIIYEIVRRLRKKYCSK